ncbi:hypothetical protein QBA35_36830 [Streptomyces bottropensis]|jgi:hypothetical protein|uniref:Uncharacterized protein n=1 Tax=Streptomyces bottropensis TaxID=42235 RepID=A0ABU8AYH8_9ACTN
MTNTPRSAQPLPTGCPQGQPPRPASRGSRCTHASALLPPRPCSPPTWLASRDADRLNTELAGKATTIVPGFTVTAKAAPFDVSDHESYDNP